MTDPIALPTASDVWRRLLRGVADRRSPFRTPALATTTPDGDPTVRTVVLRGADLERRTLQFHTDARSPKARDISQSARASWLFYDRKAALQIRASGVTTLAADGPAVDAAWERTTPSGRRTYATAHGPGLPRGNPSEPDLETDDPRVRSIFRLGTTIVDRIDWLWLHHAGHQRALLQWTGGRWHAVWSTP